MNSLVWVGLGNLALATPLAVIAWWSGRHSRRPALTHALWVLVLLKLVTPPIGWVQFEIWPADDTPAPKVPVIAAAAAAVETPAITPAVLAEAHELANLDVPAFAEAETAPAPVALPGASPPPLPAATMTIPEVAPPPAAEAAAPASLVSGANVLGMLAIIWFAGSALFLGWTLRRVWRFRQLLRLAPAATGELRAEVEQLSDELGVSCPRVVLVPGFVSPLLWVGWRAHLVLPRDLLERIDAEQRRALLIHELAHWRRRDHWVRRLEAVALALYWWCPLVWWAKSQLQQAEEECCDAWVVALAPGSARAYALALVETVDFLAGVRAALPPLASGLGPFSSLQRRLTMIFRIGTPRMLTATGLIGLGLLAALLLPWSPMPVSTASAQDEPPRRKGKEPPAPPNERVGERRPGPVDPKPGEPRPSIDRNPEDLQREVERLQREIADAIRQIKEIEGRGVPRDPREPNRRPDLARPIDGDIHRPNPGPDPRGPDPRGPDPRVPDGRGPEGRGPDGRPDLERRVGEVERKLDTILWQMTELRRAVEMLARRGPMGEGNPPLGRDPNQPGLREGKDGDRPRFAPMPPNPPVPPGGVRRPVEEGFPPLPRERKDERP
jgi:beta-lactamase regulating signal transducer with metallopeptidase domain